VRRRAIRIAAASGTNASRLYGIRPPRRLPPSDRSSPGTPVDEVTVASCQAFASPSTIRLTPRVMISGCTRKMPTPTPFSTPASVAAIRAAARPTGSPCVASSDATTKPAIDATAPTDRSIPPVSIVSVWQPARIASGMAARAIVLSQSAVRMPGRTISLAMMITTSRTSSGMIGCSRISRRMPAAETRDRALAGVGAIAADPLIAGSSATGSGCRT
jgi:hypothetical protein